jgi:MoxR-like ATPase
MSSGGEAVANGIAEKVADARARIMAELGKVIVGQDEAVEQVLIALLTGGHCLITGVPGLAKTLLIKTLAEILDLSFKRIQFTPDLMPADITGTEILDEATGLRALRFVKGPIFAQIILADEINRTPPKTQAALLEAMQERHVSIGGRTHWIDPPFFVMATQNPWEHEGVFPITESQLDRFLVKLHLEYGSEDEELRMLGLPHRGVIPDMLGEVSSLLGERGFLVAQEAVDAIGVPEEVARAIVRVTRHTRESADVRLGASPRATLHLLTASKARALVHGREAASFEDVRALALPVLGHRVESDDVPAVVSAALAHAC